VPDRVGRWSRDVGAGVDLEQLPTDIHCKRAFAVSALAALLIGGAAAIINFFYGAGQSI
jgi:hypothetical protein